MADAIVVLNAGSSSIKFSVFRLEADKPPRAVEIVPPVQVAPREEEYGGESQEESQPPEYSGEGDGEGGGDLGPAQRLGGGVAPEEVDPLGIGRVRRHLVA